MARDRKQLVLAYYGDDFSGSADVMEALSLAGVPTVLFLNPPTADVLERYPEVEAVGLAGVSRSLSVERIDEELGPAFQSLAELNAPLVHYKICSTFDSSAQVGSIGRAIELGIREFSPPIVPVVAGAPVLGRYCAFGNLFARSGLDSPVYRLDRHPTMSVHPTTPMDESDLRVVLALQTKLPIELIDLDCIAQGYEAVEARCRNLVAAGMPIVIVDTVAEHELPLVGRLISELTVETQEGRNSDTGRSAFVVGSSGVEYALVAHWQSTSRHRETTDFSLTPVSQIACVSGSCSPVTARQIDYALDQGFEEIGIDTTQLLEDGKAEREVHRVVDEGLAQLARGKSIVVHSSRGPDDPRIAAFRKCLPGDFDPSRTPELIGTALGDVLRSIIAGTTLTRFAVTGGDSSGFVGRRLGIEALSFVGPVAPGSPVCKIHSVPQDPQCADREIAFKGGQVGHPDYLVRVRDGHPSAQPSYTNVTTSEIQLRDK